MKNVLALLADWANGLFALLLAGLVTGTPVLWWYVPIGLLLSHLPDIDAIPEILRRGRVSASAADPSDHRTFLHFPLLSLPLCFLAAWFLGYWGWVLFFAVTLHLVNDLYGTGWGLRLFYPFSKRSYKVLGRRVNRLKYLLVADGQWESLSVDERKLRLVVKWSEEELPNYINTWGVDHWIRKWYLHFNFVSFTEYTLFALAVLLMTVALV